MTEQKGKSKKYKHFRKTTTFYFLAMPWSERGLTRIHGLGAFKLISKLIMIAIASQLKKLT
jgi:hypothetical protein